MSGVSVTLNDLVNLTNETSAVNTINSNSSSIETAFTSTLNNTGDKMTGNLDMNNNSIINLPAPTNSSSPVRLLDIVSGISTTNALTGTSGHVVPFLDGNNTWSGTDTFDSTTTFNGPAVFNSTMTFPTSSNNTWSGTQTYNNDVYFKTRPWADVIAFGADPTGNTDSTTAIQNAINSLTSGGVVYIPTGVYVVSSTINCNITGINIVGAGRVNTLIKSTSTTQNVFYVTKSYVEISEMIIVAGDNVNVCTAGYGIEINNAQDCRLQNLIIASVWGAINLNNSSNNLIQFVKTYNIYGTFNLIAGGNGGGNYIVCNQFDPILWGTVSMNSSVGESWAPNTNYSTNAVVIANGGYFIAQTGGLSSSVGSGPIISPFNSLITDGTVKWYFVANDNLRGIYISENSDFIAFNDISGPYSASVFVIDSDGCQLTGNTMGSSFGIGVQLGSNATNVLIQGNVISAIYGSFTIGIEDASSGSATGARIFNNYIQQIGWTGINIASNYFNISNNYITSTGVVTSSYAIIVATGISNFVISSNVIKPSTGQTGPVQITSGPSDYYNIVNNLVSGVAVVDSGTGTHKTLSGNN